LYERRELKTMTIGIRIKVARVLRNWTQLDLSIMTLRRISPSRISLLERDLIDPSEEEIKILNSVLRLDSKKEGRTHTYHKKRR
jgi:transcriptional regulator with XRE-family HTH domain